eukprot:8911656-Pyramimonas_sp.AAC.1
MRLVKTAGGRHSALFLLAAPRVQARRRLRGRRRGCEAGREDLAHVREPLDGLLVVVALCPDGERAAPGSPARAAAEPGALGPGALP